MDGWRKHLPMHNDPQSRLKHEITLPNDSPQIIKQKSQLDGICSACLALANLPKRPGDPTPYYMLYFSHKDLEAKLHNHFEQLVERFWNECARTRVEAKGSDWSIWYFDRWLAEQEGRKPSPEPNLFVAERVSMTNGIGEQDDEFSSSAPGVEMKKAPPK